MTKTTISVNRKKRVGRPAVGAIPIGVRVPPADVAVLDGWIKKHAPEMSRPEAIRRLVELGLTVKHKRRQAPVAGAARAKELAASAIDKMADGRASPDDQAHRKRRLLKGPEEFRAARVDRAKVKP
jgi:hypothetical protein